MKKLSLCFSVFLIYFSLSADAYRILGIEKGRNNIQVGVFVHQIGFLTYPILGDNIEFERTPSYKRFFIEPQIGLFGLSKIHPVFDASYKKIFYRDDMTKSVVLSGSVEFLKKPLGIPLVPYYRYVHTLKDYKSHEAGLMMTIPFNVIGK